MAADGLGDHVLAEAQFRGLLRGVAQLVNDVAEELRWLGGAQKLRQRVNLESPRAKRLEADAGACERVEIFAQPSGVARGDLQRNRQQQPLRGHALALHAAAHLLEENPFVRGVLVHEHEAAGIFHEDVEPPEHADEFEILRGSCLRCRRCCRWDEWE